MNRIFEPFRVGGLYRIRPGFGACPATEDTIDLVIAAGAFGSGEHETTASCLEVLANVLPLDGARVLDLGSGTGILAIAAVKRGAATAVCVDPDPAAVRTCRLNCELNGVDGRVRHVLGSLESIRSGAFDLVLANLYGDILLNCSRRLAGLAAPGAHLLLSGILYEDGFEVRRRFTALGCTPLRYRMLDTFTTILFRKTDTEGMSG